MTSLNCLCGGRSGIDVVTIEEAIRQLQPPLDSGRLAVPLFVLGQVELRLLTELIIDFPSPSLWLSHRALSRFSEGNADPTLCWMAMVQ